MTVDTLKENYDVYEHVPLLLRHFSHDDLRHFLSIAHTVHFRAGEEIIHESNSTDQCAYLIISGRVVISKSSVELTFLKESDFFGENSLLNQVKRTASITTLTPVIALRYDRESVLDFFRKKPERLFKVFILNILEMQSRRIDELNQKLAECRQTYRSE